MRRHAPLLQRQRRRTHAVQQPSTSNEGKKTGHADLLVEQPTVRGPVRAIVRYSSTLMPGRESSSIYFKAIQKLEVQLDAGDVTSMNCRSELRRDCRVVDTAELFWSLMAANNREYQLAARCRERSEREHGTRQSTSLCFHPSGRRSQRGTLSATVRPCQCKCSPSQPASQPVQRERVHDHLWVRCRMTSQADACSPAAHPTCGFACGTANSPRPSSS